MGRQAPISLRLITDFNDMIDQRCPLCLFLHDSENGLCRHKGHGKEIVRSQSRFSDYSFYTAQTTDSGTVARSNDRIRAKVVTPPPKKQPCLRHKVSPNKVSLRELRSQQSRQSLIRTKQSEADLQRAYEQQIMEYLESPLSEMGRM